MFQVFIVHSSDIYYACSSDQPGIPKDLYREGRCSIFFSSDSLKKIAEAVVKEAFALEVPHISLVELNDVSVPEPC